jgi:signal transduction histidine kinase
VDVSIKKTENNKVVVSVKDTGVGIKPSVMPQLFQKFTRAPDASDTNILGTGLGLYVADQILKAHDGRAWAQSEGPGKGSQFYIELTLSK